jgi:hypothetical protein
LKAIREKVEKTSIERAMMPMVVRFGKRFPLMLRKARRNT